MNAVAAATRLKDDAVLHAPDTGNEWWVCRARVVALKLKLSVWRHMSGCSWQGTFPCCRGKHHSKFFLLQYETGLRFILLTANLHHPDCCNKSQVSLLLGLPAVQQVSLQPGWETGVGRHLHTTALPRAPQS